MDGDENETAGSPSSGRACDACRSRKIRCDRVQPCSNCRMAKVTCRFSPKVNETRQRVLISNRYEKQVESIDERLQGIETNLQMLLLETRKNAPNVAASGVTAPAPISKTMRKMTFHPAPSASSKLQDDNYEGDTSLLSHSVQAKGLFEKLSSKLASGNSPRLKSVIARLQTTLKSQSKLDTFYDLQFSEKQPGLEDLKISELEVPPVDAVLGVLRDSNEVIPRFFLEMPVILLSDFTEMCRTLYFCTSGYSPALFAIVNAGLYYLFEEKLATTKTADDERYASMCRSNFALILESFHLVMAPSLEACQALILGAFYAADFAKPSLCLRLTSIAAQMCQSLGYHRLLAAKLESKDLVAKKALFWSIYALDKGLSLRLGRTSVLQDYDISTTFTAHPAEPELHCWHEIALSWTEFARFQGRVYTELYTVASINGPQQVREKQARKLAAELLEWRPRQAWQPHPDTPHQTNFELARDSTDVVYHSVLTIIYQAIPASSSNVSISPMFYSECINSARKALDFHREAALKLKQNEDIWKSYVHWTLLYSPFAPFMVVFCEAVATLNIVDLNNLRDFVASIEPRNNNSRAAVRLHDLCSAFYEVARVYFEESSASVPRLGQNTIVPSGESSEPAKDGLQETFPGDFEETNMLDLNGYMTWPTEDWLLADQYMMGTMDSGFSGN